MIYIIFDILMISFVCSFIVDISDITEALKITRKPFSCSLCMAFWCGFVYMLICYDITLYTVFFPCVGAFATKIFHSIMTRIEEKL